MATAAEIYLSRANTGGWVFIFLFFFIMVPFRFYSPSARTFEHTFLKSSPPGTLENDERWGFGFWSEGLYVLIWIMPLTLAFMLANPFKYWRRSLHIMILFILLIWFFIQLGFGIADWSRANKGTAENAYNPANDDRWCCIYHALAPSRCENDPNPCVPALGPADLVVNGVFLFRFWYNVLLILIVIVDFVFTWMFARQASIVLAEMTNENADPLMEKSSSSDSRYHPKRRHP